MRDGARDGSPERDTPLVEEHLARARKLHGRVALGVGIAAAVVVALWAVLRVAGLVAGGPPLRTAAPPATSGAAITARPGLPVRPGAVLSTGTGTPPAESRPASGSAATP